MGVMKTIAIDLAEGAIKTKTSDATGDTLYSYDGKYWFSTPVAAYTAAIKLGVHPDQNLDELEDGDFVTPLPNENGEWED